MKIPYLPGQAKAPQPSLGGSLIRYRPITAVRVTGPGGSWILDGILDTGADDTVFPEWVAAVIGLDLSTAIVHDLSLAGRDKVVRCRFLSVQLLITDGKQETYQWDAVVGFVAVPLKFPLFGHAGFLQYFDADFRGADLEVDLRANRTFTGKRI